MPKKSRLIDAALILLLLVLAALILNRLFPFSRFERLHNVPSESYCFVEMVLPLDQAFLKDVVRAGDRQTGLHGKIFAQILAPAPDAREPATGLPVIRLKVLATQEPGQLPLLFGAHAARIGEMISFETERYVVSGYVSRIEPWPNDHGSGPAAPP